MSNFITNEIENNDNLIVNEIYLLNFKLESYGDYEEELHLKLKDNFKGLYKYLGKKTIYSYTKNYIDFDIISFERLKDKYILNIITTDYNNILELDEFSDILKPIEYIFFDKDENEYDYNININEKLYYNGDNNNYFWSDVFIYQINKNTLNKVPVELWNIIDKFIDEIKSI